jgi:tripartite-type tricarboxylate transporter receptor subunit TctC
MFTPMLGAAQYVAVGRLRLLATCGEQRAAAFPGTPTMVESGYPTVLITGWTGLLAPAGVPMDLVNRLQAEVTRYLQLPDVKEALSRQGAEPVVSTPEQFAAFIKAESQKWSRVVRQAGLEFSQ